MNNKQRGWPEDCRKCDLYDQEKQDCGMRSVGSRVLYDKHRPRTEITITRMPGDWQLSIPM